MERAIKEQKEEVYLQGQIVTKHLYEPTNGSPVADPKKDLKKELKDTK